VADLSLPKTDYSKIADYYDKVRAPPADAWINKIIEYGEINENSHVLDVGCGTGRFPLGILAQTGAMICSLEPSIHMLKKAVEKDKNKKILWIQADGQGLPFKNDSFDCVYMTLVIHHILNKELALQEIHRTLKKDNKCVIMTNSHSRMKKQILHYFPGLVAIDLKRFPTIPQFKNMMIKAGFKNVHHHIVRHDEGYLSTEEYLDRVRKKHISTLTLLSEEEFNRGIKIFEKKVREKYGERMRRVMAFDFVIGKK
jgi:SAM-dependent methyltransferase